jgi:cholest-4-en-3-one 26-monooxygenase
MACAFADHPEAWQLFRTDSSVEASAIEEIIRWATPINWHRRQVTTDIELLGTQLRAGDKLIINFASANRDEERFEHPEQFQITRRPNHFRARLVNLY